MSFTTMDELRLELVKQHTKLGLSPKFDISEYGDNHYDIRVILPNDTWEEQSTSIDAMLKVRSYFFGELSFDYSYHS